MTAGALLLAPALTAQQAPSGDTILVSQDGTRRLTLRSTGILIEMEIRRDRERAMGLDWFPEVQQIRREIPFSSIDQISLFRVRAGATDSVMYRRARPGSPEPLVDVSVIGWMVHEPGRPALPTVYGSLQIDSVTGARFVATARDLLSAHKQAEDRKYPRRTVLDGVFTAAQADSGRVVFTTICAGCHSLSRFTGGASMYWPPTVGELYRRIRAFMPGNRPGSLRPEEYAAVLSFILRENGFPVGPTPLSIDEEVTTRILMLPLPRAER